MWREIVRQLLVLTLALLGALLGVVLGTWLTPDQRLDLRIWQVTLLLALIVVGLITYLVAEARRLEHRVWIVGGRIRREIDRAATLEINYRDGLYHTNDELVEAIETWRDRIDGYLTRNLPESGADVRLRTGIGAVGPDKDYEHARLKDLKSNLVAILDTLPSYVGRSR